jgi:hypothetical protein
MYKSTLAALAVVALASAQDTTTNLFLVGFTSQSIVGSIITSVGSPGKLADGLTLIPNRTRPRRHTRYNVAILTTAEDLAGFLRRA